MPLEQNMDTVILFLEIIIGGEKKEIEAFEEREQQVHELPIIFSSEFWYISVKCSELKEEITVTDMFHRNNLWIAGTLKVTEKAKSWCKR